MNEVTDYVERRVYGPEFHERWGAGPWDDEPDEISWIDSHSGFRCVVRRNDLGALCGYVAVGPDHPAHGFRNTNAEDRLQCHWGITYSNCAAPWEDIDPDAVSGLWWFGFDCVHSNDLVPAFEVMFSGTGLKFPPSRFVRAYRSVQYVRLQLENLVHQLERFES